MKEIKFEQIIQKDTAVLRTEFKTDIAGLRTELKTDNSRLETKIAESKTDMIKWFVAFFTTLALMIVGLYFRK